MNFDYIDLYFEIVGEKGVTAVTKDYFYNMKDEIECYMQLDSKERQVFYKNNRNKKKYVEELDKHFYYSYIPTAYNVYMDSYYVYDYIKKMDKCHINDVEKVLNNFIKMPLSVYNRKDAIAQYSLNKKFAKNHEKEVSKLVREEKYLMGYLNHFRKIGKIEFSYDATDYLEKYGTLVFKEVLAALKDGNLYKIIDENPYLTDHITSFCCSYMNNVKYLRNYYPDVKKVINSFYEKTYMNKNVSLDESVMTSIDMSSVILNDEDLIGKLVNGNYSSIKEFCDKENISKEVFTRMINYMKNYKPELYERYALVRDDMQKDRYSNLVVYVKNILELINSGIKVNENETREFDNLDYVLMCNMDISTFKRIVDSSSELKKMKSVTYNTFYRKYLNRNRMLTSLDKLKKLKKVIANHEVTDLEKEEIVEFFVSNGLPLEDGLVSIALRRKVKEEFDFNNYKRVTDFDKLVADDEYIDVYVDGAEKKYVKR